MEHDSNECFVEGCENHAVASGSVLNPGGPVCWIHSWADNEEEAKKRFYEAVLDIVRTPKEEQWQER